MVKRLVPLFIPVVVAWGWWHARRLRQTGRPLTPTEFRIATHVGVADPGRVRLRLVERMPLPASRLLGRLARLARLPQPCGIDGMTLGHGIYLRRRDDGAVSPLLLAHELRHVQQVEATGSLAAFVAQYLHQVARHGYRDAPFECDARRAAATQCAGHAGLPAAAVAAQSEPGATTPATPPTRRSAP